MTATVSEEAAPAPAPAEPKKPKRRGRWRPWLWLAPALFLLGGNQLLARMLQIGR